MIICGGLGTRLASIGITAPKALVMVGEKVLIDIQIEFLINNGFKRVYLALGYGAQEILAHLRKSEYSSEIDIISIEETEPRGTGGALLQFLPHLNSDLFVLYGDILIDIYMGRIMKGNLGAHLSIISRRSNHPEDSDILEIDFDDTVLKFWSKPRTNQVRIRNVAATGIFLISPEAIKELDSHFKNSKFDLDRDGVPYLLGLGLKVRRVPAFGIVQDLGTPERLADGQLLMANRMTYSNPRPAIFIDRDGTINVERGYISSVKEFTLFNDVPESIKRLKELGFLVFLITNQPIIARGEIKREQLEEIHWHLEQVMKELASTGFEEILICPHHPDSGFEGEVTTYKIKCRCRKPESGLVERCLDNYPINKSLSWIIGNSWRDRDLASNMCMRFVGLRDVKVRSDSDVFFSTLEKFVDFIESSRQGDK